MLIKKLLPAAITAAMLAGTGLAQAEDEGFTVSGNVALTSDYRFRGISQSDESAAIQGGFDAEFGPGFYVGAWGSSVDFDSNDGYDGSLELDYYGGWTMPIGDTDFSVDIGYIYYDYPGDNGSDGDYQEVYLGGAWKGLSLQVNYSDDYYAGTDDFYYVSAGYSHSFSDHLSLDLHVGYNKLEENGGFLSSDEDNYTDYSVTLGYAIAGVDLSVAYVGTTLDENDVFGTDWAEDTAIFTISKSL
jgi:uncharacterized protein (TIGR02001 family)